MANKTGKKESTQAPKAKDHGSVHVVHQQAVTQHSGPLPSPKILAEYEQYLPGTAERIITMAEREQAHRIESENRLIALESVRIKGVISYELVGKWTGYSIAFLCVGAAIYCAIFNKGSIMTGLFLSLPVVGFVRALISGSSKKDN